MTPHIYQIADVDRFVRFHPCIQRVKEIVNSGELGKIKRVTAKLTVFAGAFPDTDFRYNLALGGGAFMDLGCSYRPLSSLFFRD